MRSILRNGGEEHYTAYVLHSDLDPNRMNAIQQELGERVSCQFITVDPSIFADFPESKRYPKQIYYRLAAPLLLPSHLDRVLYLDVDIVVINPLKELYETDFEGNYYIACTHTKEFLSKLNQARLGAPKGVPYINTGVMVLNLSALRENLSLQDIQAYAKENTRKFILPDQDILTALYGDKIKLADTMRYNLSDRIFGFYNADPKNNKIDVEWVRQNSSVIHYCGKNKPWKEGYGGPLGIFYQELNAESENKRPGAENQRAVNIRRLEHDLSELEANLTDHYCSLGKQILEVAEREDREINQLVDQIVEVKKQLSALQQTVQCPKCLFMNSSDSRYCSHCGNKL
jgi:lipopolysaccharide biosynthesis glycosyltransferase